MKVLLIKKDGKAVGWSIEGETDTERLTLGAIRNMQFFGLGDTAVQYAGIKHYGEDHSYVAGKLAWVQECVHEEFGFNKLDEFNNMEEAGVFKS